MNYLLLIIVSGLVIGSVYGLISICYAIIYKATGVVNFAVGEIMMLNAYIAYTISTTFNPSFVVLLLICLPIALLVGLLVERLLVRPLLGEPVFTIVMTTIGLGAVLRGAISMVRGAEPHEFTAGLSSQVLQLGIFRLYPSQLLAMLSLAVISLALWALLRYHTLGVAVRAVASNEAAAILMGVKVGRVHALVWALSSCVSCLAGILFASMYNLSLTIWFQAFKAFPAVIFGGLDSVVGGALGGIVVGTVENAAQAFMGNGLKEVVGFFVIIVVLMVKPYGLFGQPEIKRV